MEGVTIRSKAKWVEYGEKVSKYFCNLESRHFRSKAMTKITTKDGSIVQEQIEILQHTKCFYEQLYKYKEVKDICLSDSILRKILTYSLKIKASHLKV